MKLANGEQTLRTSLDIWNIYYFRMQVIEMRPKNSAELFAKLDASAARLRINFDAPPWGRDLEDCAHE